MEGSVKSVLHSIMGKLTCQEKFTEKFARLFRGAGAGREAGGTKLLGFCFAKPLTQKRHSCRFWVAPIKFLCVYPSRSFQSVLFCAIESIDDGELKAIVNEVLEVGQAEADLGAGVYKVRVARLGEGKSGGYRVIVFFKTKFRTFFTYGFEKSDRANIDTGELRAFKDDAKYAMAMTEAQIAAQLRNGTLTEVL
jgi:hypothetical protein